MSLENLLARIFGNNSTQEEKVLLDEWKNESEENLEALAEMEKIWEVSEDMKSYDQYDGDKAWRKLNSAIVIEELKSGSNSNTQSTSSIIRRILPIAASLLLLAAITVGVNHFVKSLSPELPSYTAEESIIKDVVLSDMTKVVLDKNSTLKVISDFKKSRTVSLSGKAFYHVKSDASNPFTIKTNHGDVTVVGTQFTLSTTPQKTELFLMEGRVNYDHNGRKIEMTSSEAIEIKNGELLKYRFDKTNSTSWYTNKLVFENTSIGDVLKTLEKHFEVEITTSDSMNADCELSSTYQGASLDDILSDIGVLFDLQLERTADKIIIKKLSC